MQGIYTSPSGKKWGFDLLHPFPIGIPFEGGSALRCFNAPPISFAPLQSGNFIGAVDAGSPVNFYDVKLNPHGNGTHTETVRHISNLPVFVGDVLPSYFYFAALISIEPEKQSNGDRVITLSQVSNAFININEPVESLIVRTLPNSRDKLYRDYSGTNPPYFSEEAMHFIRDQHIQHLLTDLPSVDKEQDDGLLKAHKSFWNYPQDPRKDATITELIFVQDTLKDGLYILQLQPLPLQLDASPSCPILYPVLQ